MIERVKGGCGDGHIRRRRGVNDLFDVVTRSPATSYTSLVINWTAHSLNFAHIMITVTASPARPRRLLFMTQ